MFLFAGKKRKFLFKCNSCGTILLAEFEEEQDFEDIRENKLYLECPCGEKSEALRD